MKKILLIAAALIVSLGAYAQGTVNFATVVISGGVRVVDAAATDISGATGVLATGAAYQAQLYAGATASSLAPVGAAVNFLAGGGAGYVSGGSRTTGVAAGASAFVQVRAWKVASGTSWETASIRGESATVSLATGGSGSPPSLPANLLGLGAFTLNVPEPSTIALGILGAGALLAIRRRK